MNNNRMAFDKILQLSITNHKTIKTILKLIYVYMPKCTKSSMSTIINFEST